MRVKILYLLCLSIFAVVPAMSQVKSVTNADLEKFRQKRLQAERDYRENYARLGFPSPEELEKQNAKSSAERYALSARLTAARLQREEIKARRAEAARYSEQSVYVAPNRYYYGYPNWVYYGRRFPRIVRPYSPPISVGNGIPFINYGYQTGRPARPQWLRP